jgi:hypothetical protein
MAAGPGEAPRETAAERRAAEQRRELDAARLETDLTARYAPAAPGVAAHEIEVDMRHALDQGMLGVRDPEQPANLDNVEAAPRYQPILDNMRTKWNQDIDDPISQAARQNAEWPGGVPTVATIGNPAILPTVPSIEEASNQRLDIVADKAYRLEGDEPDGLFNLSGRLEGTSPQSRAEVARDRALYRRAERVRRLDEMTARMGGPGGPAVPRLLAMFEEGMARGEFKVRQYQEEVTVPARGGRPATTRMEARYGVEPAGHAENRELTPEYVAVFNEVLATRPAAEQRAFSDSLGRIPRDRISELTEQGNQAIERSAEQGRMAVQARETISRLGSTPEEAAARDYEVTTDEARERRDAWYRARPEVRRVGMGEERTRLNFDDAYEQAMDNNSVWAAGVRAMNNMPEDFWDRYDDVRAQRDGTQDRGLRDTLDESMNQMMAEAQEVQAKAEEEQERRNERIHKAPARLREVASGAFQENRREWLMNQVTPPNNLYATYNANLDRFEGPQWGLGGVQTPYEQDAMKPYLKLAMQAAATGRGEDERRFLGLAADAREKAFGEVQDAVVDSEESSREIATQLADAVAAHEAGTFEKGITKDEALNQIMIQDLQRQLGMETQGFDVHGNPVRILQPPDGTLVHRDEPPKRKNGKPMRGRRGKILAKDLIYRVPGFDNAVMVTRWNPDGQLISCEVQVTEDTAMRQRHGFGPASSGGYTREPSPELQARLEAQFEEQKPSAANPVKAARETGNVISLGAARAAMSGGGEGGGYYIPPEGGLWARESIQDRLVRSGMDQASADLVSHRRMQARQNGKPRQWWWERATSRDYAADGFIQRRAA